jgi:hypothetical protein
MSSAGSRRTGGTTRGLIFACDSIIIFSSSASLEEEGVRQQYSGGLVRQTNLILVFIITRDLLGNDVASCNNFLQDSQGNDTLRVTKAI